MASAFSNLDQRSLLYAGAFVGLSLLAVYRRYSSSTPATSLASSARGALQVEKDPVNPQQREPGEWKPVPFDYPIITPCAEDPRNIKPVPYRPFKWGEYHVTMGLRTMPWDEWFELDNQFIEYHRIRERRLRTRGDRLVQVLPPTPGLVDGGHDAAVELVQEMAEFLVRRYPTTYSSKRSEDGDTSGWYGLPRITEITIIPTGRTYKVDEEEPMALAGIIAQDDIAIMIEGSDGQYYFQAGSVLIPGMWRLKDKIGMTLDDIHFSGTVPQYESKLQLNMNRFFDRMPLDKPVTRANYSFQVVAPPDIADPLDPNELSWAQTMKGDEEDEDNKPGYLRAKDDPSEQIYGGGNDDPAVVADLANSTSPVHPSLVRMRVERETLRKLPRTGAIIFAIRTYQTPLEDLAAEPGIPGRLASAIRSWPEDVAVYKARTAYESVLGYLDERHAAQVTAGLVTPSGDHINS